MHPNDHNFELSLRVRKKDNYGQLSPGKIYFLFHLLPLLSTDFSTNVTVNKPSLTCSIDFLHICYDSEELYRIGSCAFLIAFLVGSLFNFISEEFQFTISGIIVDEQDGENADWMVTIKYLYSHALVIFEFFFKHF